MIKYIIIPIILYFISPYLRYRPGKEAHYVKLAPSPAFEGNLEQNNKLEKAVYFANGKVFGAETILFINETLYTGLANGQLVSIDKDGNTVSIIAQSGDASIETCSKIKVPNKMCGLILGIRFKKPDTIYMVDSYNGLLKVNIFTKEKTYLLKSHDKIFGEKPFTFANDLDLDDDGNLYFTQSTTEYPSELGIECYFDAAPNGRLFQYNESTKELKILADDIRFAHGIQLTPEQDAIIVAEISMARLLKYHLKGPRKGTYEVFVNLPGSPDNIRMTDHGTLLVPMILARSQDITRTTALDLLGEYPLIRNILSTFIEIQKVILALPKYALIVEYSFDGEILKSWHDPTGKIVDFPTSVTLHNNKLYIGSFYMDHINVVDY